MDGTLLLFMLLGLAIGLLAFVVIKALACLADAVGGVVLKIWRKLC